MYLGELETLRQWWPLLIPILIIDLGLIAVALWDLYKRERVKGGNKWVWLAVILLISTFGPIIYLVVGREE
jgi:hypothetical protein